MGGNILAISVYALLLAFGVECGNGVDFDQEFFGVEFSPWVTYNSAHLNYTFDDLKIMLEVVSTKFSKLKVCCVEQDDGILYPRSSTDNTRTNFLGKTVIAAAYLNRERGRKALTVLIGVQTYQEGQTGIFYANSAAEVANEIFPGTVEGIYFRDYSESNGAHLNNALKGIETLQRITKNADLKIGLEEKCPSFVSSDQLSRNITMTWIELIKKANFVICDHAPGDIKKDLESIVRIVFVHMNNSRDYMEAINPNILVMWSSSWPTEITSSSIEGIKYMQSCWEKFNNFSTTSKFVGYMNPAMDIAISSMPRNLGWWCFTSDNLINNEYGCAETVLPQPVSKGAETEAFPTPGLEPTETSRLTTYGAKETGTPHPIPDTSIQNNRRLTSVDNNHQGTSTEENKQQTSTEDSQQRKSNNIFVSSILAGAIGGTTFILLGGLFIVMVKRYANAGISTSEERLNAEDGNADNTEESHNLLQANVKLSVLEPAEQQKVGSVHIKF